MHGLQRDGPPQALLPELPTERCKCPERHAYERCGFERLGTATVHCMAPHYTVEVPHSVLHCPARNPECVRRVDAGAMGLYQYSDRVFVALRRLYECTDLFTGDGRSVKSYVRTVHKDYDYRPGGGHPFLSPNMFRKCFYQFIAALQRKYSFQCPICRDCPDVLIGDATAQTMRSEHYLGCDITSPPPPSQRSQVGEGHWQ